ncbi:MAG: biotin/lipoyl-containing protein, partial [Pseudomonadota bacterium]|nr:biotin/lipoyl-containing protein [Pseudomonadota bacterium]
ADRLEAEMPRLTEELLAKAKQDGIRLADGEQQVDDVLTYALFPQIGLKFLKNRDNPDAFEPAPEAEAAPAAAAPAASAPAKSAAQSGGSDTYTVTVNGTAYVVEVAEGGDISQVQPAAASATPAPAPAAGGEASSGATVQAPLAGNIFKVNVKPGDSVAEGDVVIILEAMKMETEVRAASSGTVSDVKVAEGDSVAVGDVLVVL